MQPVSGESHADLRSELELVRGELVRLRNHRGPRAWVSVPLIIMGSWMLSAQAPASADIERRLTALESMIRRGPRNSVQVTGPFDVVGKNQDVILSVSDSGQAGGHIQIERYGGLGFITIRSGSGEPVAGLGQDAEGHGAVYASDQKGVPRAQLNGRGSVVVFDESLNQLAAMVTTEGRGRVGVWNKGQRVASLDVDIENGNAGRVSVMSPAGALVSAMGAGKGGTTGMISVANTAGKPVAGMTAGSAGGGAVVVTNASGVGLAEMSVSDGRGLFQVFARSGGRPIAVMTQSTEQVGGLLQISNSGTPVASLTVGNLGAGYLQLNDPSGNPTVEAGTLAEGNGQVRAGPDYQCLPVTLSGPINFVPNCIMGGFKKKK